MKARTDVILTKHSLRRFPPTWHLVQCAAVLCALSLITGCLAFLPKVNVTRYTVDDTQPNREAVAKCITSVGKECGMSVSTNGLDGSLFWHYSANGGLTEYFERAEFGFRVDDISNLQSLALKVRIDNAGDEVSRFVRSHLSPATLDLLAHFNGGTDAPLQTFLINDLNDLVIMNGIIYDSNRFNAVKLSPSILELLAQKLTGYRLYKLNRMLLDAAYPDDLRPMGPDKIMVDYELKSKIKSKEYVETEARLTGEMKAVFSDALRTSSFVYWLP